MIEALIAGERNPGRLADLARGVLRRKTDDLQMACDGRFTAAHGQMCRLHLDAYDHLTATIAELDALVAAAAAPFAAVIARLMTIPGIGRRTSEVIVAETGARPPAPSPRPGRLSSPPLPGKPKEPAPPALPRTWLGPQVSLLTGQGLALWRFRFGGRAGSGGGMPR